MAAAAQNGNALEIPVRIPGAGEIRAGAYGQAIDKIKKATGPDSAQQWFALGWTYLKSGDTAAAIRQMRRAAQCDSVLAPLCFEIIGDCERLRGKNDSGLAAYARTMVGRGLPDAYRSRVFEKINAAVKGDTVKIAGAPYFSDLRQWLARRRRPQPSDTIRKIDSLIARREWAAADSLIHRVHAALSDTDQVALLAMLDRQPRPDTVFSTRTLLLFGQTAKENRQYETAERVMKAAAGRKDIGASVNQKRFLLFRGQLSFAERAYADAIVSLRNCIRRFGNEAEAVLLIGRAYHSMDSTDQAMQWYDRYVTLYPAASMVPEILWRLGWMKFSHDGASAALPFFQKIYRKYTGSSHADDAFFRCGICWYESGRYDSCRKVLSAFEQKYRDSPFIKASRYWRAKCLLAQNRFPAARDSLAAVAEFDPLDYYSFRARQALTLLGDSASAVASIDTTSGLPETSAWLDSLEPAGKSARHPLSAEDSMNLRRGMLMAALGAPLDAEQFLEPVEQSEAGSLSFAFGIAVMYRLCDAPAQAYRSSKRLFWRISPEDRKSMPVGLYACLYPLFFNDFIKNQATIRAIDPALVRAVIRQESGFNPSAVSAAGAVGLMQIMPKTGKEIAGELKEKFATDSLYQASFNIRFGTWYLNRLLGQFNDNLVLALAAYNGGPLNTRKWYTRHKEGDFDEFVEDIEFRETRGYVKKVLGNYWAYRELGRIPSFSGR